MSRGAARTSRTARLACFGFDSAAALHHATESLRAAHTNPRGHEVLPISTCQRHELYWLSHRAIAVPRGAVWLGEQADAALRLFQLAAGTLSDIPGEQAVSRQLAASLRSAIRRGHAGRCTIELVRSAIQAGAHVRERARQSTPMLDLADLVRDLITREIRHSGPRSTGANVLLLGAGDVARSVHAALQPRACTAIGAIQWATRRPSRRRGVTMSLAAALPILDRFDVVIAALANAPALIDVRDLRSDIITIDLSEPAAMTGARWPLRRLLDDARERLEPQRQAIERAAHRLPALADAALAHVVAPSVAPAASSIVQFRQGIVERELARLAPILETVPHAAAETIRKSIRHTAARCVHPMHEQVNQLARQGRSSEAITMIDHLLGSRVGWCDAAEGSPIRNAGRSTTEGAG